MAACAWAENQPAWYCWQEENAIRSGPLESLGGRVRVRPIGETPEALSHR